MKKMIGLLLLLVIAVGVNAGPHNGVVDNLEELRSLFYEHQAEFIPLALPGDAVLFQDFELSIPFNAVGFPKKLLKRFSAEMSPYGGVPVHRITLIEDFTTRQVVICDFYSGSEIWRMDVDPFHDPYAYLRWRNGLSAVDSFVGIPASEITRLDSAKVAADFMLVENAYYPDYVIAEEMERQAVAAMPMLAPPLPDGVATQVTAYVTMNTNSSDVSFSFSLPQDFGRYAEIFKTTNLKYVPWTVAENRLAVTGGTQVAWVAPNSSNENVGFYILSDAGIDDDKDGYSNLREIYTTTNNPQTFVRS